MADQPDGSPYAAAAQPIPKARRSQSAGLARALVSGAAVLVQTCLLGDAALSSRPTSPWRSIWPATPRIADPAAENALEHAFWTTAQLCPAWPANGLGLAASLRPRDGVLTLPRLPRFDAPNGPAPTQGQDPTANEGGFGVIEIVPTGTGETQAIRVQPTTIDTTVMIIIGGTPLHVLTGQPLGPAGTPILGGRSPAPGDFVGYGEVAALETRLAATVRDAGLALTDTLGDVVDRIVVADYELPGRLG
jgi:hypothetical protein